MLIALLVALAFLWWRLIDHLCVEWSINPQYAYGWAVPFLCLYLAWRRVRKGQEHGPKPTEERRTQDRVGEAGATDHASRITYQSSVPRWVLLGISTLLALLWLPTRLIQEANPEWRLVSWALAFEVVGLTVLLAVLFLQTLQEPASGRAMSSAKVIWECRPQTSNLIFPICFMLVAVPWPSVIEEPIVQSLSRATAALTSEALNLSGMPAVQRGNVVEVGPGLIGIEEACSGIRSFQAALMLSVFFGGLYRLTILRRLWLVLAGFVLAFGSNVVRTTVLASAAAKQGMAVVTAWHNPVGLLAPLACFLSLALLARVAARAANQKTKRGTNVADVKSWMQGSSSTLTRHAWSANLAADPRLRPWGRPAWPVMALLVWLVIAEAGTECWYRAHETGLPAPLTWRLVVPLEAAALDEKPLPAKAKQLLRFDAGRDATWYDAAGRRWQAIFLYWAPGRVAARLAKDHTPAICLSAAGRCLLAQTKENIVTIRGLRLRVYSYVATDARLGKVHVLYFIREDRSLLEDDLAPSSLWQERVRPVLRGRRNSGQRSLELAVWGIDDEAEAKATLIEQMQRIVRMENTENTISNS